MKIETRTIDFIPLNERHGSVRNLFSIWFSSNMQIATLVTGGLAITMGLNVFWSLVAIILGNLIGGVFMASHSAQGPKLGIPQMIQSRAQFGYFGAIIPIIIVILMYLGYFATGGVLGAQAISAKFSLPQNFSLILLNIVTFVVTVIGYDLIHKLEKYLAILSAIIFAAATFFVFGLSLPANSWAVGNFHFGPFMMFLSIVTSWQMLYAPYVADYSRYLPVKTSTSQTFWYSYAGTVISTIWMMSLGVALTAAIPKFLDNSSEHIAKLFGTNFSAIVYLTIILGILGINVLNLYGAFISSTTVLISISKIRITPWKKILFAFITTLVGTAIAILGKGQFMSYYSAFVMLIQYLLLPWSAINLVDYYFLRHGDYSVKDIFDINGIYGKYNWSSLIAYFASIIIEIPFMNTEMYEGPIAKMLGGADIAWIIGFIIPAFLYYYPMKNKLAEQPVVNTYLSSENEQISLENQ